MKDLGNTLLLLVIAGLMLLMVFGPYKRIVVYQEDRDNNFWEHSDKDTGVKFLTPKYEYDYVSHYGVTDVMAEAIIDKYDLPKDDFEIHNSPKKLNDTEVFLLLRLRKRWHDPGRFATGDWSQYEEREDETQNP